MLVVLTGGARSGKSSAAIAIAQAGAAPVVFLATAEAGDEEMTERIRRHRDARPAGWTLIEEPVGLVDTIAAVEPGATVIVDCLALWVANLMADESRAQNGDSSIRGTADELAGCLSTRSGLSVVVTNEVGSGIVPDNATARGFRDLLGHVNQRLVGEADRAYLCVAGQLVELRTPAGVFEGPASK
jgi:adenosylcobinamide kinase / adenosylcobinamide-phosphate guanylyltransferase